MERLCNAIDSLRRTYTEPKLLVMGDFNDYADSPSLLLAYEHGLFNVSAGVQGRNGAKGTYRYHGEWGSLDQMLVSDNLRPWVAGCRINDAPSC